MRDQKRPKSILPQVLQRYALLAIGYTILIWLSPASKKAIDTYNITAAEYHILIFANAIPSLLAWLAAFVGYAKLHDYAYAIKDTKEGRSFELLATGTTWLAWALPVPILFSQALNGISHAYDDFRPASLIITNIISVVMPFIAFIIIGNAARALTAANGLTFSITKARSILVAFIAAGLIYCYVTLDRFDLSSINNTNNPYFMPLWLMLIVIIVPYLYSWFTGVLAAYEITELSKKVKGVLYRQSLQLLVLGLLFVIGGSIASQYMYSASPRVGYLVLNYKLVLAAIFRVTIGIGFILIAMGATRLKRIEEI